MHGKSEIGIYPALETLIASTLSYLFLFAYCTTNGEYTYHGKNVLKHITIAKKAGQVMDSSIDYTSPSTQFTFDVNKSPFFKKDNYNFMNILGVQQLNTLDNISLLDIFLSTNNNIEPHYHPNAAELVYCISGELAVSILNPFTKQYQHYTITPGQVANIPQGWWHYQMATEDRTHIIAIFNASTPEVILGSDILKLTPSNIMAHTYCMNENEWKKAIAPVMPSTYIGPPKNCNKTRTDNPQYYPNHFINQSYPMQ